ncbi:oxygenase MpaB family protein [Saccharothrix syringae]|uniref:oxygenase MpaB family protein n=1 Tax=Saccharothrix syringae TaxID=103733 RepID=UPI000526AB3E|nr:oxygenase MpaB family protein [Saccharothrix syringae]
MIDAAAFEALKFQGDPLADAVVADLVATNRVDLVNEVLEHFRANDQPIPEQLPGPVREFLVATDAPPAWVEPDRIARAYDFFVDDGMHVASVLTFGAMINCYAHARGARALTLTHGLDQPQRRLSETSQFVMNMMGRDAFGSGGSFVPTIQKTRLIHAAVRHFLIASGRWDVEADGVPVCRQDMVGALLIFSVQVVEGMRRIGISVTEQEAQDYYYVWRAAGAMLGIPAEAVPESIEDARELSATVVEAAYGPSPEGVVLTRHLLDLYEGLFPGKLFDGIVAAMVRQVVNPEVADWMQVPDSRGWGRAVGVGTRLVRLLERSEDSSALATTILDRAGALLLGGSVRNLTNGQSTTLSIPTDLRERWEAAGRSPLPPEVGAAAEPR